MAIPPGAACTSPVLFATHHLPSLPYFATLLFVSYVGSFVSTLDSHPPCFIPRAISPAWTTIEPVKVQGKRGMDGEADVGELSDADNHGRKDCSSCISTIPDLRFCIPSSSFFNELYP